MTVGEAKRRGIFEDRKARAIERKKLEEEERKNLTPPIPKVHGYDMGMMIAILAAGGIGLENLQKRLPK